MTRKEVKKAVKRFVVSRDVNPLSIVDFALSLLERQRKEMQQSADLKKSGRSLPLLSERQV